MGFAVGGIVKRVQDSTILTIQKIENDHLVLKGATSPEIKVQNSVFLAGQYVQHVDNTETTSSGERGSVIL